MTIVLVVAWPAAATAGFLEVEWDAPTTNADGSPLNDLQGYRIYTGTSAPACPGSSFQAVSAPAPAPAPGDTFAATLTGLTPGTTYSVRVTAVDTSGNESACTAAVSGVARTDLGVTPASLSFGSVTVGTTATLDLTVQNLGVITLSGTATTASPFSIVAGGTLNLAPGASQVVSVQFAPLSAQSFSGNVSITTSGDDVSRPVSGTGVMSTPAILQFSQAGFGVTEGGTATVTVTRTGGTHGGVTVSYATSNGTATAGADYTAASGTLTFGAGETSRTFTVATLQDTLAEGPETLGLTLSNPQGGASLGTPQTATLTIADDDTAGSVQFQTVSYTVGEGGGSVTLTVTRTGGTASGVTVAYATANGTATAGADYSARSGTLTFNAGVASQTITVPILQDTTVEAAETFTVTLSSPGGGAALGSPAVATVTIADDEGTPAVLQFSQPSFAVNEGGTATVTVTRTGSPHGDVTVQYATGGGSAVAGTDYAPAGGTLTFAADKMTRTFTVTTVRDRVVGAPKTIGLTLSSPQGGAVLGTPATAMLTVQDADVAGTVQFALAAYRVREKAGSVTLTVARTGGGAGGVTVPYATAGGSAAAGADYGTTAGTLTFDAGVTSLPIVVPILQDSIPEGPETFTVALGAPGGGATLGARSVATVTIVDDEPDLRFSAATYTAGEADGLATITVTRVGSTAAAVSVDYATTAAGTAAPHGDFTPVSGTLSFAPGEARRSFTVPILDDDVVDGPKTVGLQLANAVGAALGAPSGATLRIVDDDVAGTIQFGAAKYTADEAGGTFNVPVKRTGGKAGGVTVSYAVGGGTAAPGVDFTATASGTLTFGPGVALATIPIHPVPNTVLDGPRTLELTLSSPGGGAGLGSPRRATVTIDEVVLQFGSAVSTVREGGIAAVSVVRTGPTDRSVTVDWISGDGTATAGADYVASSGTLTFPAGVRAQTIRIATLPDTVVEGAETILLALRNPGAGTLLGAQRTAVVTIRENDAGGSIAFAAPSHVVTEGLAAHSVAVVRTGGLASGVTVDYAVVGGTATGGGVDYTLADGTLTFAAGQTRALIPLTVSDDGTVEANETIVLQLSNPTGGATLGRPDTATITIKDADRTATLQFGTDGYTVVEGAGSALITVTRKGSTADAVSAVLRTSDGTAVAGTDYTAVDTPVTFSSGITRQTVAVPVLPNTRVDGPRTVRLTLGGVSAPAALGAPSTAVLTIQDDDSTLAFSAAGYDIVEGGTATVTVQRAGSGLGTVSVTYATTDGTATAAADYVATSGRLTFGPGVVRRTFEVRTRAASTGTGDRTVRLTLSGAAGQATIGPRATATLTISGRVPAVKFAAPAYSVSEGKATATLAVLRTGPTTDTVTVDYTRIGGTATGGGVDYAYTAGTLTFPPGVKRGTFTVAITDDALPEGPETVVFRLGNATGAAIGTPDTATLTIEDNEPRVRFAAATYTASETGPGLAVAVRRTGPTDDTVTVSYAVTGGTATNGLDYSVGGTGRLTFGPGVTKQTFMVVPVKDGLVEPVETIVLALSNPVNATLGTPAVTTVNITSKEAGGSLQFERPVYSVEEGSGAATITVTWRGGTAGGVTVDVATVNGSAVAGTHYTPVATTLTFAAGQASATFTVPLTDDGVPAAGRSLELVLSDPTGGARLGTPNRAVLWILDDD